MHEAVLHELRAEEPGRLLDIGCGTGILAARVKAQFPEALVVGCDYSAGMLQQAARRTRRVAWLRGDALRLAVGDESVDTIVSTESFHWFPDHDAVLREFRRILTPGGRLLLALVTPRLSTTSEALRRSLSEAGHWPTRQELRARLDDAGLEVRRRQRIFRIAGLVVPTYLTVATKA